MYSRVSEKGPLYYNCSYFIENSIGIMCIMCIITNKWVSINKNKQTVLKETFVEALKVIN